MEASRSDEWWLMSSSGLDRLVSLLVRRFEEVIGPVAVDGAIRLRPIESIDDLPVGVTDEQETATYRLRSTGTELRFSYGLGPDSLKALVHPPRSPVWTMRRSDGSIAVEVATHPTVSRAVIGVRACDIRALRVLEHTQTGGPHPDPAFAANRAGLFLVAVDCTLPAPTCFCDTAGNGPASHHGYDIAMTELDGERGPVYVVRVGSERGRDVVDELHLREAPELLVRQADLELRYAAREQIRELTTNAAQVVVAADHPHWHDVAARCLTCGNCTAVCPTCFCTDMDDRVSLDGETATRERVWDTCFRMHYSHLGGGPQRETPLERYRQWLSHKLGTWHEQFGESGCVGCGRCITWCPVGIDLTAEIEALAEPVQTSVGVSA
jgi:ferredoxin